MSTAATMDRALERKRHPPARIALFAGGTLLLGAVVLWIATRSGTTSLRVEATRLTTSTVQPGEFRDYYPVDGRVEPSTTVYLDVEEGGRVEQILVAGGHPIAKGTLIMRLSNANLQRSAIETETRLIENLDLLRNTELTRAQSSLELKDALLDLEHQIIDVENRYARYQRLGAEGAVSVEVLDATRNDLSRLHGKRDLLKQRIEREDVLGHNQVAQARESIERLTLSRELLRHIVDSLEVRAPIDGFLSSIDAEVGENMAPGRRIGQIDQLDAFKMRARIDQYYLSRVELGTPGKTELDGKTYAVAVKRIYPEVVNDTFTVDLDFTDAAPPGLRRGQRLTVELSFGASTRALIVERGGFMQNSGGRWVYLVSGDGRSAHRVAARFGRQNPRYLEVLEGLRANDRIVTSSYSTFNDVDELDFSEPIPGSP
ncbi:MAG TPA: HlyD family efflux transporter periplasmic adaptor subunit [Steroidobacteraceae bacterium]|jgi:HlyD family secretion protein|nr:HlyD family efflux transporter periplasmic adaptor subunit [Steroidobacteraceae bacterium]